MLPRRHCFLSSSFIDVSSMTDFVWRCHALPVMHDVYRLPDPPTFISVSISLDLPTVPPMFAVCCCNQFYLSGLTEDTETVISSLEFSSSYQLLSTDNSRPFTVSQDHEVHAFICQSFTSSSAAQPFIWFSCLSYLCAKDMELLTSSHSAISNSSFF